MNLFIILILLISIIFVYIKKNREEKEIISLLKKIELNSLTLTISYKEQFSKYQLILNDCFFEYSDESWELITSVGKTFKQSLYNLYKRTKGKEIKIASLEKKIKF